MVKRLATLIAFMIADNLLGIGISSISSAHEPRAKAKGQSSSRPGPRRHTGIGQESPQVHFLALLFRSYGGRRQYNMPGGFKRKALKSG